MLNIIAAELIFAAIFVGTILVTWPNPPWTSCSTAAPS
jgi:hypothetical protein